ncbi:kinase-like protein [Microstroma glucosiphilum]|uniref:Kinase-like protein n=1 Tax=Pseudomicrostroma glucosiphilum TaxID=1684307 RepID=A0A316UBY0_9BASI|nr:kinase-like protein [Pseudomicrostroma glucosiphilum]PWN22378.1 kinase-like protein [Pseudomicrostroma glucosiphilum]
MDSNPGPAPTSPLLVSSTLLAAPRRPSATSASPHYTTSSSSSSSSPSSSPAFAPLACTRSTDKDYSRPPSVPLGPSHLSSASLLPPPPAAFPRRGSSASSTKSNDYHGNFAAPIIARRLSQQEHSAGPADDRGSSLLTAPISRAAAKYAQALAAHHSSEHIPFAAGQPEPSPRHLSPPVQSRLTATRSFDRGPSRSYQPSPLPSPVPSVPLLEGRRGSLQATALLRSGMAAEASSSARAAEMTAAGSRQSGHSSGSSALYSSPAEANAVEDLAYPVWSLPGSPLDDGSNRTPPSSSSRSHSRSPALSRRSSAASPHSFAPSTNTTSMMGAATAALQLHQLQLQSNNADNVSPPVGPSRKSGEGSHQAPRTSDVSRASSSLKRTVRHYSPQTMLTEASASKGTDGSVPTTAATTNTSGATSRATTHPSSPRSGRSTPSSGAFSKPGPVLETNHLQLQTHVSGRRMINQYIMDKQIGSGQHGKVRLARDTETGERVAIKIVEREGKRRLGALTGAWQGQKSTRDNLAALAAPKAESPDIASAGNKKAIDFASDTAPPQGTDNTGAEQIPGPSGTGSPGSPSAMSPYAAARYGRWGEGHPSRPTYADLEVQRQREKEAAKARKAQMWTTDQKVKREIAILKKCNHENVVKLKEVIDDPQSKKIFMVLEYMAGGEVKWVDDRGFPTLTVSETRSIIRDVVLGLEYLHYQGIIHRDIKPANLLWDGNHTVKISDFGVSHFSYALLVAAGGVPTSNSLVSGKYGGLLDDHELAKTAGSPAFFAPELCQVGDASNPSTASARTPGASPELTRREFPWIEEGARSGHSSPHTPPAAKKIRPPITKAIDVWALGVTLYCLLFGQTPFNAETEFVLFSVIPKEDYALAATAGADRMPIGPRKPRWAALPTWEDEEGDVCTDTDGVEGPDVEEATLTEDARLLRDLLDRLLDKNPVTRIKLEEVKQHPWIVKDLEDPKLWLQDTDPTQLPSLQVTHEEVEDALTGFSKIKQRIKNWRFKLFGESGTGGTGGFSRARSRSQSSKVDDLKILTLPSATPYRNGPSSAFLSTDSSPKSSVNRGGSSRTTPGTDAEHHTFRFFKRSNQRSNSSYQGSVADTETGGRSGAPSQPSSPNLTGAAAMLRQIADHSQSESDRTAIVSSGGHGAAGTGTRRPLWRRRSTSRAPRSGSASTARRPSTDRSSSDTRFETLGTRASNRSLASSAAHNPAVSSALSREGPGSSAAKGGTRTPDTPAKSGASRTLGRDPSWNRSKKSGEYGRSASSAAGSHHRVGDLWHRLWSREEGGGSRGEDPNLRTPGVRATSAAAHYHTGDEAAAQHATSSTETEGGFRGHSRQSSEGQPAAYTMEALRPATRDVHAGSDGHGLSGGFELPPMIDVNDIDDELEFSDDDAGLDSRPGSFLRNDGRGWSHSFGSASRFTPSSELSRSLQDADHSPTPSVEGGYNLFKPPYTGKTEDSGPSHLRSPNPMYQQEDRKDGSRVSSLTAITGGTAAAMPIGSSSGEAAALRKGQIPLESPPVARSQGYAGASGEEHPASQQYSAGSEDLLQLPKRQWLDAGEESRFADADESSLTVMGPVLDGHQAQAQAASGLTPGLGLSGVTTPAGSTSSRPSHTPAMIHTSSAPGSDQNGSASHIHSPTSRLAAPSWGRRGSGRSSSSGSSRSRSEGFPPHTSQQQQQQQQQKRREDRHVSGEEDEDEGASSQSEGECVSFRAKARRNGARSAT